ncbi:MAG: transporter [Gammaproteobacteria bacterium]|nr:transporter [Gammaproteobacteria bacterium]
MKKINQIVLLSAITAFFPMLASAASFQSLEQSAARLGAGDAGTATNTSDAAIEYFNPAGMSFVGRKVVSVSGIGVLANIRMHDAQGTDYMTNPVSGDGKGPHTAGVVPGLHYVQPINNKWAFGAGINVPYGLETIYPGDSMARYFATKSKIATINFGLSFSYKITKKLSAGIGIDPQYMSAELDQMYDNKGGTPDRDVYIKNKGKDWGVGFNAGLFYIINPTTRVGLSYRSRVKHNLKGYSDVDAQIAVAGLTNCGVSSDVTMPASTTLSLAHEATQNWLLEADAQYTQWNVLKKLTLNFTDPQHKPHNSSVQLNYHNSWRFSVGEEYKLNNKWTLRNGFTFDETPTDATYKTARIPDSNRYWITFGARYNATKNLSFDAGYAFILFNHSHINLVLDGMSNATLQAGYKAYAQLFGLQVNYNV